MPAYFASDVHLRLDRSDRALRFVRFVDRLGIGDSLVVVGDLCDFWFASRQATADLPGCPGLEALASFRRRGGDLTLLAGNHDAWLGPFYERRFGVGFTAEPLERVVYGRRVHLVHGHRMGARPFWKAGMESLTFLGAFRRLPAPIADRLDSLLERNNDRTEGVEQARHLAAFRRQAAQLADSADIAVFGHIHAPLDDTSSRPRLVVLGGWRRQSSYLRIDEAGARLVIDRDQL